MKINAVITKKPRINVRAMKLTLTDKTLIAIAGVMLTSIICGALAYKTQSEFFKTSIFDLFAAFSTDISGKTFFEAFSGFFAVDLSVLFVMTILGTCAFGRIPILITTIFRTIGVGMLGAYLFDCFGFDGIKYFLIITLPGKILIFFALLLSVQNCFQTSRKMRLLVLGKTTETVDLKIYMLRNAVAAVVFALAATLDTALLRFLSQYFLPEL